MLYTPMPASSATTMTVGIYTIDIPDDSSDPSSGDLYAYWAIDPTLTQSIDTISLPVTIVDNTGVTTGQTATLSVESSAAAVDFYDDNAVSGTNIHITPNQAASPGTYTITLTVMDNGLTATAYINFTIAATSGTTDPPSVSNGQYSVWVWPPTGTIDLNDSIIFRAGLYYPNPVLLPITFTLGTLPDGVFATPGPILVNNEIAVTLYTSDNTPASTSTITITGTWTADPTSPPPANSSYTASFTFQLIVDPNYIPPNPSFLAPVRGRSFGIVGGRSRAGHVLRRFAQPLNPRTPNQMMARATFRSAKLNWQSIGPFGANNTPTLDVDPQSAWLMQNLTYNGILTPGVTIGTVQAEGTLGPCSSPEAYQTMVQINRTNLNLSPLPTPAINNQYLAFPASPYSGTIGVFTVTVSGFTTPQTNQSGILLTIAWDHSPLPDAPTDLTSAASTLLATVGDIQTNFDYVDSFGPGAATATATDTTITYTQSFIELFTDISGELLTASGFAPDAYNVTNAVVLSNTEFTITVGIDSNPGPMTMSGMISGVEVIENDYSASITVVATPSTTAGSYTLHLTWTDVDGAQSLDITLSATAGVPAVAFPCARYQLWTGASASLSLGPDYVPFGIVLTPVWSGVMSIPNQIPGGDVPFIYEITASDLYTAGQTKPDVSAWLVILFTAAEALFPDEVLGAWEATYGDLADSGYIGFLIQAMNPADGTVGPAVACTVHYVLGTATAIDFPTSTCPFFQLATQTQGATGAPGSTITISYILGGTDYPLVLFETDSNGQLGPAAYTATLPYDANTATYPDLPPWLSVTFGTPTETAIAPYPQQADTWYTSYSVTLASDAPAGSMPILLTGSQSTQTSRATLTVTIT